MKKTLFSVVVIIGLVIGFSLSGCDNGGDEQGITLVCFGDSLTAGYNATTLELPDKAHAFPAYLQSKINIPVVNAGVSGDKSADGLLRVDRDVVSQNPQIVIIEFGANDLFNLVPVETTKTNLLAIIKKLEDGNRKIYLAKFFTDSNAESMANAIAQYAVSNGLVPSGVTADQVKAMISQKVEEYDAMFTSLASSNNVELIEDIWSGVWGEAERMSADGIHPNAAGYAIMANNYFEALEPYLAQNGFLK
jgi:acyl-CoA thioesterase-1